jgi:RNA polymerase sigma factor (sigma-70 family)
MAAAATVYVVDDDASVRKSLTRLLRSAGYQVESFVSGAEFLDRPPRLAPACLVLDIRMPGLTGLDLQRALARRSQPMAIVFITGHGDIPMSVRAMKAGAVDFLTKPYSADDMLGAVRRALEKDGRDHADRLRSADIQQRVSKLTPREQAVFDLVVQGRLNKQIAGELGISEKTVKVHRARVMEKMRAESVADLVRMAAIVSPAARSLT